MPKAILKFNLPEEQEEHKLAVHAVDLSLVLLDLDQYLRTKIKYADLPEEQKGIYQHIRDMLHDLVNDHGLDVLRVIPTT